MTEADVVYSDIRFGKGKTNEITSSSADSTYSEVKISKTKDPAALPGSHQPAAPKKQSNVTSLTVALLIVCALLAAAIISLGVTFNTNIQTIQHLRKLQDEAMKRNLTADRLCETEPNNTLKLMCPKAPKVKRNETYPRCEEGWEHNRGKCYLFSTNRSSWENSRNECKQLGGDLVKIDSREEQDFLAERLRKKHQDYFWIGLTDSKNEGDWLWVDGSRLNGSPEPDNWKQEDPDGEDCVRMGETGEIKKAGLMDPVKS